MLDHMLQFGRRRAPRATNLERIMCRCCTHLRVSDYLNVEMTNDQACILDPTLEDVTLREILKDAGGSGATKKLAKRKMDAAGFVNAHCCEVTGEKRQRELNSALELAASLAEIHRAEHEEATSKKQIAEAGFQETARSTCNSEVAVQRW